MTQQELPDAELEVLAALWHRGGATAREVREALTPYRPMTHGAVSTLLKRLEEKGLVSRRKGPVGKAFVFKARVRPGSTYRRVIDNLVERIFGGNSVALVTSLFETRPPSAAEIDELQGLLDDLRGQADGEKRRRQSP